MEDMPAHVLASCGAGQRALLHTPDAAWDADLDGLDAHAPPSRHRLPPATLPRGWRRDAAGGDSAASVTFPPPHAATPYDDEEREKEEADVASVIAADTLDRGRRGSRSRPALDSAVRSVRDSDSGPRKPRVASPPHATAAASSGAGTAAGRRRAGISRAVQALGLGFDAESMGPARQGREGDH